MNEHIHENRPVVQVANGALPESIAKATPAAKKEYLQTEEDLGEEDGAVEAEE